MIEKAYTVRELEAMGLGGLTFLYAELKSKRLTAKKIGSRTVVMQSDLDQWLAQLRPYAPRHAA